MRPSLFTKGILRLTAAYILLFHVLRLLIDQTYELAPSLFAHNTIAYTDAVEWLILDAGPFIVSVVLWAFANRLAKLFVPPLPPSKSVEEDGKAYDSFMHGGFMLLGGMAVIETLTSLVNLLLNNSMQFGILAVYFFVVAFWLLIGTIGNWGAAFALIKVGWYKIWEARRRSLDYSSGPDADE